MADISKIIGDLKSSFGGSNEEQMKAVQLLKGLATSDDPKANKFMKALDTATTKIAGDMKEGIEEGNDTYDMDAIMLSLYNEFSSIYRTSDKKSISQDVNRVMYAMMRISNAGINLDQAYETYLFMDGILSIDTKFYAIVNLLKKKNIIENEIEVTEDAPLPGTNIVLEKGDKFKVLTETDSKTYNFKDDPSKSLGKIMSKFRAQDIEASVDMDKRTITVYPSNDGDMKKVDKIMKEADTGTAKCPDCGGKYLKATGYCVSCKKKVGKKKENVIEIPEDVQLPGSDIVLEKGDWIEVLTD